MQSQNTVTDRDLLRLLDVVEAGAASTDDSPFPFLALATLKDFIGCDEATFLLNDGTRDGPWGSMADDDGVCEPDRFSADEDPEAFAAYWAYGGCSYPQDTGDYTTVLRRSDRFGDRAYALTAMGRIMQRNGGVSGYVMVSVPPLGVVDRRLMLMRYTGSDFTDREVMLLRLLRPHISEMHLARHRRLAGSPDLTSRQWQILRLVSAGASNREISRRLYVSEATVRKHLEHIFARLGVTSRTEAAADAAPFLAATPLSGPFAPDPAVVISQRRPSR